MNQKQQRFVTEYLRIGDKVIAYRIAYQTRSTNLRSLESAVNRLLNDPEVAKAISDVQSRIRADVEQELKEEFRRELLSVQRKRELLAAIATGDILVEQHYKGKGCATCTQLVRPTINQMLKAIDIDSKLARHYTVNKPASKTDTIQPVKPLKEHRVEQPEPTPVQGDIAAEQELGVITDEKLHRFICPEVSNTRTIALVPTKQYQQLE
ncbi:MAG: hypothetical protein H6551_12120 [Chitinophagales bacterium]|nr:hypothetical protein [Chitinophagaceae bacterium]MCB9065875.1 hypothetical protein [Chitinophagales bacterium]